LLPIRRKLTFEPRADDERRKIRFGGRLSSKR